MFPMDASVIVPACNEEKRIAECLQSLLCQETGKSFEVILADDGSADSTIEIAKSLGKNVRILKQRHRGPAAARNLGARNAKGDVLVFVDADCVAEKNWLDEMLKPFADPNVSGVQGRYRTRQKSLMARFTQLEIEDRYDLMAKKESIDFIGSYSAAYRKKIFLEFGGFNEEFRTSSGEDTDLSYGLSSFGKRLVFAPRAIVFHSHPETLAAYLKTKFFRAYWRILLYKKHRIKMVKDSYTRQSLKAQIIIAYAAFPALALLFLAMAFGFHAEAKLLVQFSIVLVLAFLLACVKLTGKVMAKDPLLGVLTPFLLALRSIVFSLGLLYGFYGLVLKRPT